MFFAHTIDPLPSLGQTSYSGYILCWCVYEFVQASQASKQFIKYILSTKLPTYLHIPILIFTSTCFWDFKIHRVNV